MSRTCGLRGPWVAECPKRCKTGQGGKGDDGKGQGKKGKAGKGKSTKAKDCFTLATTKNKGGKGKSAVSLDETEASGPENISDGIWFIKMMTGSGTFVAK